MEKQLYLVNYCDGGVQESFDNADQLIDYLKRENESGTLMGEAAFGVFFGQHPSIRSYWKAAFEKAD